MKKFVFAILILLFTIINSIAAEKKQLRNINTDDMTSETQITPIGSGNDHVALTWWIPNEFWDAIFSQDSTISEFDKNAMLQTMNGISMLAIVQADISIFGSFNFYSKNEIENNLNISYLDNKNNQNQVIQVMKDINPDLELLLNIFKPILSSAMGNMGNNMHFFVLNDESELSERIIDPYEMGILTINLLNKKNKKLVGEIETPLNSLYIPRKCPNGKNAHVSWKYCPWTGEKLED